MNVDRELVYGERVADLLPALVTIGRSMRKRVDGMFSCHVTLDPKTSVPLERALMRIEAELLQADAAALGSVDYERRTGPQRSHDALVKLAQAIIDAA
jgi:hypothetical protein